MPGGGKLGKLPYEPDPKDFKLQTFLREGVTLPPLHFPFGHANIFSGDGWQMFGNGPDDSVRPGYAGCGNCVFAMIAHYLMEEAKIHRRPIPRLTGKTVVGWYSDVTGYVLDDEATDQGTIMRDAFNWWRTNGYKDDDGNVHKIAVFFNFNATDPVEAMQAARLAGASMIGFNFQAAQDAQFDSGLWDFVGDSEFLGGHAVPMMGAKSHDNMGLVSWARRVGCTTSFIENLNDESWAVITTELFNKSGLSERGMNYDQVQDALNSLK